MAVVDADQERAATVADDLGCAHFANVNQLLRQTPGPQAVSIAVPTVDHFRTAQLLLAHQIACLIEKPLALNVREANELIRLASQHDALLQVGHTERFNPAVRAVAAMKLNPRFMEVHRISTMTFRSVDVGVVMDMMIHDLDIVLMLVNAEMIKVDATGVSVIGEHEDVANARLVFATGTVANLTASRLALKNERKMRVFSETAYVSLDYQRRKGLVIRKQDNETALAKVRKQLGNGADLSDVDYTELVSVEELSMNAGDDERDALTSQLDSFLASVRDGTPPVVDGPAGRNAIAAAERVVNAIQQHSWEGLRKSRL